MEMSFVYYWLLIGCLILSMAAQARIRSAYAKYSRQRAARGCTAREMVARMMREEGIENVAVGQVPGELTDHYDPKSLTLRLSAGTADSDSIAALAVAAHEMGHVLQHRDAYAPLSLRTLIAPTVQIGSSLAMPLLILGLVLSYGPLVQAGIVLYALITLFTFITLPVEIYNYTKKPIQPKIYALFTLMFVVILVMMSVMNLLQARDKKLKSHQVRRPAR